MQQTEELQLAEQCAHGAGARAFVKVDGARFDSFDDQVFAMELLEKKHVLIAPGSSFNVAYRDHFRITTLPRPGTLNTVFERMEEVLEAMSR